MYHRCSSASGLFFIAVAEGQSILKNKMLSAINLGSGSTFLVRKFLFNQDASSRLAECILHRKTPILYVLKGRFWSHFFFFLTCNLKMMSFKWDECGWPYSFIWEVRLAKIRTAHCSRQKGVLWILPIRKKFISILLMTGGCKTCGNPVAASRDKQPHGWLQGPKGWYHNFSKGRICLHF